MSPSGTKRVTFSRYYRYDNDDVTSCAISGDGYVVVSTSWYNNLKVWDATSGIERLTLSGHTDMVTNCVISGDGRVIVSASKDRTLKVWDAITGIERLTLSGHSSDVYDCVISGDGRVIVSASKDRTLKIWDATTAFFLNLSTKLGRTPLRYCWRIALS